MKLCTLVKSDLWSSLRNMGQDMPAQTFRKSHSLSGPNVRIVFMSWREKWLWFSCFQCHSTLCIPMSICQRMTYLAAKWHLLAGSCCWVLVRFGVDGSPVTSVTIMVCLVVTFWMAFTFLLRMLMWSSLWTCVLMTQADIAGASAGLLTALQGAPTHGKKNYQILLWWVLRPSFVPCGLVDYDFVLLQLMWFQLKVPRMELMKASEILIWLGRVKQIASLENEGSF